MADMFASSKHVTRGTFIVFAAGALTALIPRATVAQADTSSVAAVFAPGVISGPGNDSDPAFTPDGDTVYFARNDAIMVSRRAHGVWSSPDIAPFSGRWRDQQPTFAPDGHSLIFVSNRPIRTDDSMHPAGNLWRVDRHAGRWGEPLHLPEAVNRNNSTWAPSVSGDGSIYFINAPRTGAPFRLWRSQYHNGQYETAVPVSFGDSTTQDVDPAVAPDESFIVFGSKHQGADQHERLFIAFKKQGGWGVPVDLGDVVNGPDDTNEGRLSPDHRTLYFSSDRTVAIKYPRTLAQATADLTRVAAWDDGNLNIWSIPLARWLDKPRS